MPARDQLLEHLPQHFGVDRDLDVERRRLHHGEVEAVEQAAQDPLDDAVRHDDARSPVQVGLLEQPTVQERRRADLGVQDGIVAAEVSGLRVVQPREEEQAQPIEVEVLVVAIGGLVVLPEGVEVVIVVVEGEPPFAGEEVDEHEAVEQRLDKQLLALQFVRLASESLHAVDGEVEYVLILLEERPGDGLDVECLVQRRADAATILVIPVDMGYLLHGSAARQVPLDDHAAQGRPRALEAGLDQVKLAGGGVGENE